ncbi:hypothetical protein [Candidatus Sororendozoicomonas aggregata]|uniref:hypothetical protein n=1 Tax=Candidatus Sororendozoicomonas aggregata TaxID=3073239 RepID=UPI002ED0569B
MSKSDSLAGVTAGKPPSPKRANKKKASVASRMTSSSRETSVFSLRVPDDELIEMNQLAEELKKHTRMGDRNTLLRACFQAMKEKNLQQLLKIIRELP